jgi:hypothetical protein
MQEDVFNTSIRKLLKEFGVTAQRLIAIAPLHDRPFIPPAAPVHTCPQKASGLARARASWGDSHDSDYRTGPMMAASPPPRQT